MGQGGNLEERWPPRHDARADARRDSPTDVARGRVHRPSSRVAYGAPGSRAFLDGRRGPPRLFPPAKRDRGGYTPRSRGAATEWATAAVWVGGGGGGGWLGGHTRGRLRAGEGPLPSLAAAWMSSTPPRPGG